MLWEAECNLIDIVDLVNLLRYYLKLPVVYLGGLF